VPARTRLVRPALFVFALAIIAVVIARSIDGDETPSYKLTNAVEPAGDGIATNSLLIGDQLPTIKLENVDGQEVSTQSLLNTPLIINVWYSTCEPCRREMPVLATTAKKYLGQVGFVGINIKDSATVAKEFASQYGVEFELLLDKNGLFISRLGIATAPVTLAIDKQGVIIGQKAGEISASQLDELVKELLK